MPFYNAFLIPSFFQLQFKNSLVFPHNQHTYSRSAQDMSIELVSNLLQSLKIKKPGSKESITALSCNKSPDPGFYLLTPAFTFWVGFCLLNYFKSSLTCKAFLLTSCIGIFLSAVQYLLNCLTTGLLFPKQAVRFLFL